MIKINSIRNLVPLQSLSLDDQKKCIAYFGNPYDAQPLGILKAYKNLLEKGKLIRTCKVECKLQLPGSTAKVLCETCKKLSHETPLNQLENHDLNENKQGLICLCQHIVQMSRVRKKIGAPRISHNQVYKWMQDLLIGLKYYSDNNLQYQENYKIPGHLSSNV